MGYWHHETSWDAGTQLTLAYTLRENPLFVLSMVVGLPGGMVVGLPGGTVSLHGDLAALLNDCVERAVSL